MISGNPFISGGYPRRTLAGCTKSHHTGRTSGGSGSQSCKDYHCPPYLVGDPIRLEGDRPPSVSITGGLELRPSGSNPGGLCASAADFSPAESLHPRHNALCVKRVIATATRVLLLSPDKFCRTRIEYRPVVVTTSRGLSRVVVVIGMCWRSRRARPAPEHNMSGGHAAWLPGPHGTLCPAFSSYRLTDSTVTNSGRRGRALWHEGPTSANAASDYSGGAS